LDAASKEYRLAIQLDPKGASPHNNLGTALYAKGQLEEAISEYRLAIKLDPKSADLHHNLNAALYAKGQLEEAIRECRLAIKLDPKFAQAHGALGLVLAEQGRFAEAREANQRCLKLLPPGDPLRQPVTRQLRQCEQSLALDQKISAILKGEARAKNPSELLRFAGFCLDKKKHPAAAARLYADAFTAEPALADDLGEGNRFAATRAAALAGRGTGRDAETLDEMGRARWRKQAHDWLRADLTLWAKQLEGDKEEDRAAVREALRRWQADADLAGLRDPDAVAKLPPPERAACQKLWADVANTLARTNPAAPTERATKGP
jgi:serine/threonine-protein kinase